MKGGEVMKNRAFFNWLIILIGVIAITSFCFTPSFADDLEIFDESFGENSQVTWLGGPDFVPGDSDTVFDDGYFFQKFVIAGSPELMAVIRLPSGARLVGARLYAYDNSSANASLNLREHIWTQGFVNMGSAATSGTPGYTTALISINKTIQNADRCYEAIVTLDAASGVNLRLFGVKLYWYRQISPAPSSASFFDVPTNHWAFQKIEALAASGITVGCGGGNFCPDQPVTRAQMAVFLAKALGLHWDYNDGY
jgi:hypothetical protein